MTMTIRFSAGCHRMSPTLTTESWIWADNTSMSSLSSATSLSRSIAARAPVLCPLSGVSPEEPQCCRGKFLLARGDYSPHGPRGFCPRRSPRTGLAECRDAARVDGAAPPSSGAAISVQRRAQCERKRNGCKHDHRDRDQGGVHPDAVAEKSIEHRRGRAGPDRAGVEDAEGTGAPLGRDEGRDRAV